MSPANAQLTEQCVTSVGKIITFPKYVAQLVRNFKAKTVNNIESEVDSLYIGMIGNNGKKAVSHTKGSKWFETASIRGVAIRFKLDTGADANVLPMCILKQLPGPIQLHPTTTVLVAFGGARLPSNGVASLQCKTARHTANIEFHVAREADKAILGGEACTELGLVKRVETHTPHSRHNLHQPKRS